MSQGEVWEIFQKYPDKWLTSDDLSEIMNVKKNKLSKHLNKLRQFGIIYRVIKRETRKAINNTNSTQNVRYFKLVPKGKYVTFDYEKDTLNNTGKTYFYY